MRRWLRANLLNILGVTKVVLMVVLLILVLNIQVNSARQSTNTAQATQQIKALSEDNKHLAQQNKQLGEQNAQLSKQNQQYLGCNFLAFAHFTQTFKPIQDSEINSCNIAPVTQGANTAPAQSSVQNNSTTTTTQPSNTSQGSSASSTQPSNSIATPPSPSFLDRLTNSVVSFPGKLIQGLSGLF